MDFWKLQSGSVLKIETQRNIYIGIFKCADNNELEIYVNREVSSGKVVRGVLSFLINGMKSIAVVDNGSEIRVNLEGVQTSKLQTKIEEFKYGIYITKYGFLYERAMIDIGSQSFIGIMPQPLNIASRKQVSGIVISTQKAVYIYDALAFGEITHPLKKFLEDDKPKKIVHNTAEIKRHFETNYKTKLGECYDICELYSHVTPLKENWNVVTIARAIFSTSVSYFDYDLDEGTPFDIYRRPMSNAMREYMVKRGFYMLKLYQSLSKVKLMQSNSKQAVPAPKMEDNERALAIDMCQCCLIENC